MKASDDQTNPYKKIAELHNKGLEYLIKKKAIKTAKKLSKEQIIEIICEFFKEMSGQDSMVDEAINYSILIDLLNKNIDENSLDKLELSENAVKIIKKLLAINSENEYEILKSIAELEKEVFNSNFNIRDKNYTLLLLAIAQASVKYWAKEINKGDSIWSRVLGKVKLIPWKADVKGGLNALIDPSVDVIFQSTPLQPVIVVVKVIGSAIFASAMEYNNEAKKLKEVNNEAEVVKNDMEELKKWKEVSPTFKLKPKDKS
jgi:hypothetical protein